MPLTTAELASRIASKGDDVDAVTERVKRWAKTGLLFGGAPGRGGSRRYDHGTVIDAAVLNALAGIWGFSLADQDKGVLLYACGLAREMAKAWAAGDRQPRWLEFVWVRSGINACVAIAHTGELKSTAGTEANLTLNVSNILARLNWGPEDEIAASTPFTRRHK
jgi:hypothetical protein